MILNLKIFDDNISFSLHQAKSNIWRMSVLPKKFLQKETKIKTDIVNYFQNQFRYHCYMYSHFIWQYVHAFSVLNWARTKLRRLVGNWILMSCQPHRVTSGPSVYFLFFGLQLSWTLSSTSALLLSLASANLSTTSGKRVFVMVPEIQNNGISIKLYPGNNL